MRTASKISGVLVVGETEPEKTDVIAQAKKLALPIISGEAVVVVPDRGGAGIQNYPETQKKAEARGNLLANSMMKERGIMTAGNYLDWWVGVRFIKNSPEVLDDYLHKKEMKGENKLFKISRPGDWSDAMFTPLVDSLRKYKEKVKSVPISYSHPLEMTEIEEKDPAFDRKRAVQLRSIVTNLAEKVRDVEDDENKPTRLVDVESKEN